MKNLLLVLALVFLSQPLLAQVDQEPEQKFNFGLRFNPLLSFLKVDEEGREGQGPQLGFSYGAMGQYNFARNYSLVLELKLVHLNGAYSLDVRDSVLKKTVEAVWDLRTQYLEIPLLLKMETNQIGYTTFFGTFGISNGILTKAKAGLEVDGTVVDDDLSLADYERGQPVDADRYVDFDYAKPWPHRVGLIIGGGLEYAFTSSTSAYGSVTFNNGVITRAVRDESIKNAYVALNLGILF